MIPVSEPLLGEAEIRNVMNCLQTGWISSAGAYIEQFEAAWAKECGVKFGVAVCNGTAALQIAVEALELEPGDEVILPSNTIISCAMAIVKAGTTPVIVDCDPRIWCMNVEETAAKITPRTRAIMPVHMYGHPVDMDPLLALAERHDLWVLEDAAEVHGAEYFSGRGGDQMVRRRCGGMGDLATFSFFANKLITTGEGGMVVTNNSYLAEKLRGLRNLCFRPPRRFYHTELGYNFRMTNIQAAIGVAQVPRLREIVDRKRAIAARYTRNLAGLPLQLPFEENWAKNVYWVYGVVLDDDVNLDATSFAAALKDVGVETRPFFLGMHEQPVFHDRGLFQDTLGRFPVTERITRRGLYLPSGLTITDDQIDEVSSEVRGILDQFHSFRRILRRRL